MRIIIDLRCLQDPDYATRGIGQHARGIIAHRPPATTLIGLADPRLPPLPMEIIESLDATRPNGYFDDPPAGTVFLNPSPMTADPLFVARLLQDERIAKAAIIHDFIPLDLREVYLRQKAVRMRYVTALSWLAHYDSFLPVSAPSERRLHELLGVRPSFVTGVALDPFFHAADRVPPRHILVVAGDDPRKNPELVIKAHAGSAALQSARIPLHVTGGYDERAKARFRALALLSGGDDALLQMPGHVEQAMLRQLYREAFCVVTASGAEGFSLPVIEAMAFGIPSIASDIPAHAELIADPALRFAPEDEAGLRLLLEEIAANNAHRAAIVAAQAEIWPAFTPERVAARLWTALLPRAAPNRVNIGGHRPRIGFISPFPPARSGIADYSAACVEALSKNAELVLFSEREAALVAGMKVAPLSTLAHLAPGLDRVISVLGNSHYHGDIYDLLLRYGGTAISHDSRLLHFHAHRFGVPRTAQLASEELRREVSMHEVQSWLDDEAGREASLLGPASRHAGKLIFHAQASVDLVQGRFGVTANYLPFALQRSWAKEELSIESKRLAKQRLQLDPSQVHIASFGHLIQGKGMEAMLAAMRRLRACGVPAQLHWVGDASALGEVMLARAATLGVRANIHLTQGYLSEVRYRDYFLAADFGLQLRNSGPGSISGALQDCIAAGLPTIANASLAEALDSPGCVFRVSDALDATEIAAALSVLIDTQPVMSCTEWAAYCDRSSMANYAAQLCRILELAV